MPTADEDLSALRAFALAIAKALDPKTDMGECGGKSPAHCAQRRVLIVLGWLDKSLYAKKDIKNFSVPAIQRLQRALGVKDDGDWGGETAGALARVLEKSLPIGGEVAAKAAIAAGRKPGWEGKGAQPVAQQQQQAQAPAPTGAPGASYTIMGMPWWVAAAAAVVAGVGSYLLYRRGKAKGLEGCACGAMGDGDAEGDDERLPPEIAEHVEELKHVPQFKPSKKAA